MSSKWDGVLQIFVRGSRSLSTSQALVQHAGHEVPVTVSGLDVPQGRETLLQSLLDLFVGGEALRLILHADLTSVESLQLIYAWMMPSSDASRVSALSIRCEFTHLLEQEVVARR